jgi:DNA repair protein RecN (Recombination protein N)
VLREIRIQNLGVIDDAVLELSEGLNVVSGETGAGKTMVVSGLGLLLGDRADAGRVRDGASQAVVEGFVDIPTDHPAAVRAAEAGGDVEDGLILVRSVSRQGRSRAHVGGRSAPVGVLAELGELLVAVHGQADQWRLRRPEQHRVVLDRFAGESVGGPLRRYTELYAELQDVRAEVQRLRELERDRARQVDVLRTGLEEIEAVDPQPGEDDDLRRESERLAHADGLRVAAGEAHLLVMGGDDALAAADEAGGSVADLLGRARAALAPVVGHDPQLAELDRRLQETTYAVTDVGGDLAAYQADLDVDPARLAWVGERRAALGGLLRKYGESVAEVLAWGEDAAKRLTELEGVDDRLDELQQRWAVVRAELAAVGTELSAARTEAAGRFAERVGDELAHLAMGNSRIEVAVRQHDDPDSDQALETADGRRLRCGPSGLDDVEILLAAGSGSPPRGVAKAASGGELSRLMLALELVTASGDVPTFVFDEVDAGVGGAAALEVGSRLAALARTSQVVVVTHLAQVAAFADRHLVVSKTDDGHVTASGVAPVEGEDRVRELARMLGGVADSAAALEHARELLQDSVGPKA